MTCVVFIAIVLVSCGHFSKWENARARNVLRFRETIKGREMWNRIEVDGGNLKSFRLEESFAVDVCVNTSLIWKSLEMRLLVNLLETRLGAQGKVLGRF